MTSRPSRREHVAFAHWAARDSDMVSALLALVGHDLRTPLNAVIGFSDAMERQLFGPLGDHRYEEYARHIRESGAALLRAAEQTLALAALTAAGQVNGPAEAIGLRQTIDEAFDALGPQQQQRPRAVTVVVDEDMQIEHHPTVVDLAIGYLVKAVARPDLDVRISAERLGGEIVLRVETDACNGDAQPLAGYASLARVLLEGQGCDVQMQQPDAATWQAIVSLREAAQPDLGLLF